MINLEKCILNAWLHKSKLGDTVLELEGMSSPKIRHLLNNLCSEAKTYLEVGCWKGSTLISAAYGNKLPIYAVDNFSEFNNGTVAETLYKNITRILPNREINLFNSDFRKVPSLSNKPTNIDLYFYDGEHSDRSQYDAIACMSGLLANEFILVIDDWNYPDARTGTMRAINDLKYKIHDNYTLPAKFNGDIDNWWNGVWIARITK
jgi:hypothetical protein